MSRNNRLPFAAVSKLDKILDKFRSYHLVVATFMTVLLLGVAPPAQAVQSSAVKAAPAPNFMCYIGSPTLDVFDPSKSMTQRLTSVGLGIVILLAAVGIIWGGIRIMSAGKHADKAGDGVRQLSNTVIGLVVIFGGLVVLSILVGLLVSIANFGC